jgi:hypothetical protein
MKFIKMKVTKSKIIKRIERQAGVPDLLNILSERIKPTDLQSLLLAVFQNRVKKRKPSDILADYSSNSYVTPSKISPKLILEWDQLAFSNLPQEFKPLELSPLAPLASVSRVAPINQDWILTTIRNVEVVSDPSNILALECALQRKKQIRMQQLRDSVHLATSQRVVRTQKFDDPDLFQHFRLFSLCSAGRTKGNLQFEFETIKTHIHFYIDTIRKFLKRKLSLSVLILDLSTNAKNSELITNFTKELRQQLEDVEVRLKEQKNEEKEYYQNIRFQIYGKLEKHKEIFLIDGGITPWTQKLLNNAKERLTISGLGTERLVEIASQV